MVQSVPIYTVLKEVFLIVQSVPSVLKASVPDGRVCSYHQCFKGEEVFLMVQIVRIYTVLKGMRCS